MTKQRYPSCRSNRILSQGELYLSLQQNVQLNKKPFWARIPTSKDPSNFVSLLLYQYSYLQVLFRINHIHILGRLRATAVAKLPFSTAAGAAEWNTGGKAMYPL
jgi:hypothetical protein